MSARPDRVRPGRRLGILHIVLDIRSSSRRVVAVRRWRLVWHVPMSLSWEPASSARRSRPISPRRACRRTDRPRRTWARRRLTAIPASSKAIRFFRRHFRRTGAKLLRIALKRSPVANYHLAFLPRSRRGFWPSAPPRSPSRLVETAQLMRPLIGAAVAEHETMAAEAGAERYLRHTGWLKLYRTDQSFAGVARELELAAKFSASPMCRSMAMRRLRSNRRWRRYFVTPCIGPAR